MKFFSEIFFTNLLYLCLRLSWNVATANCICVLHFICVEAVANILFTAMIM